MTTYGDCFYGGNGSGGGTYGDPCKAAGGGLPRGGRAWILPPASQSGKVWLIPATAKAELAVSVEAHALTGRLTAPALVAPVEVTAKAPILIFDPQERDDQEALSLLALALGWDEAAAALLADEGYV